MSDSEDALETWAELKARFRLMGAAPALLSALERLRGSYKAILAGRPVRDAEETLAEVDAAIRKALGEDHSR